MIFALSYLFVAAQPARPSPIDNQKAESPPAKTAPAPPPIILAPLPPQTRMPPPPPIVIAPPPPPPIGLAPAPAVHYQVDLDEIGDTAETLAFSKAGVWHIRIDTTVGGGCYAVSFFDNDVFLRVSHNPQSGIPIFGLGSSWWHSLQSGDEELFEIAFGAYERWAATGMVRRAGGAATLYIRIDDGEFFSEMRDSKSFTASSAGRDLGTYAYQGFGEAMEAIVDCQKTINEAVDPFASPPAESVPEA